MLKVCYSLPTPHRHTLIFFYDLQLLKPHLFHMPHASLSLLSHWRPVSTATSTSDRADWPVIVVWESLFLSSLNENQPLTTALLRLWALSDAANCLNLMIQTVICPLGGFPAARTTNLEKDKNRTWRRNKDKCVSRIKIPKNSHNWIFWNRITKTASRIS